MQVHLLCSGSKGNACLVRSQGTTILIDCGKTKRYLLDALKQVDCQESDIDALFITHGHGDHIAQYKWASQFDHYQLCAVPKFEIEPNVMPYQSVRVGCFSILILPLSHDYENTMGLVIDDGMHKLVYVTDTGFISQENLAYMGNADGYVLEFNHDLPMLYASNRPMHLIQRIASDTGHLNNEDAAHYLKVLVGNKTKEVIAAHLSQEANTPSLGLASMEKLGLSSTVHLQTGLQEQVVSFHL